MLQKALHACVHCALAFCRSSLDTAIAERRVRVRVSEAGTVIDDAEAAAAAAKLETGLGESETTEQGADAAVERPTTAAAVAKAMGEELEALFGFTKAEVRRDQRPQCHNCLLDGNQGAHLHNVDELFLSSSSRFAAAACGLSLVGLHHAPALP